MPSFFRPGAHGAPYGGWIWILTTLIDTLRVHWNATLFQTRCAWHTLRRVDLDPYDTY